MTSDQERMAEALRRLPVPEPDPEFVRRALARATGAGQASRPARRIGPWAVAAAAAAVAAAAVLLRPADHGEGIHLQVHEPQDVHLLIDSERVLQGVTITVTLPGQMAVVGFGPGEPLKWQTDLDRGHNLLSLPVVAGAEGAGRLVATVEHDGRRREIVVELQAHARLDPSARGEAT